MSSSYLSMSCFIPATSNSMLGPLPGGRAEKRVPRLVQKSSGPGRDFFWGYCDKPGATLLGYSPGLGLQVHRYYVLWGLEYTNGTLWPLWSPTVPLNPTALVLSSCVVTDYSSRQMLPCETPEGTTQGNSLNRYSMGPFAIAPAACQHNSHSIKERDSRKIPTHPGFLKHPLGVRFWLRSPNPVAKVSRPQTV